MMLQNKIKFLIFTAILFGLPFFSFASTTNGTIDSTYKYAWSNNIGAINFGCKNCSIVISDTAITGYAWNNQYGWINFGPFSNNTQGGVKNTNQGILSGYAWGSNLGWINFSGVLINSNGQFTGQTPNNPTTGIINFDFTQCQNCGVKTDWRPASSRLVAISGGGNSYQIINLQKNQTPLPIIPEKTGIRPVIQPDVELNDSTTQSSGPSTNLDSRGVPSGLVNDKGVGGNSQKISVGVKNGWVKNIFQEIKSFFYKLIVWFMGMWKR